MMEFVFNYGLFLAKAATILIFIWLLLSLIVSLTHKPQEKDHIEIKNLNDKMNALYELEPKEFKKINILRKYSSKLEKGNVILNGKLELYNNRLAGLTNRR